MRYRVGYIARRGDLPRERFRPLTLNRHLVWRPLLRLASGVLAHQRFRYSRETEINNRTNSACRRTPVLSKIRDRCVLAVACEIDSRSAAA